MEDNHKRKRKRPQFYKGSDYHNQIRDWTSREKTMLLNALKKYGYLNMKAVYKSVPTKSKDKIKMFISLWFKTARSTLTSGKIHSIGKGAFLPHAVEGPSEKPPLDQWLEKLESAQPTSGYNESRCLPIAKALLYISKFECHPDPEDCCGVDFKALYEYLYCMLCGYPAKSLSSPTAKLVLNTLSDLSTMMKEKRMIKELEHLDRVQRITYNNEGKIHQYPGKKSPPENTHEPDEMESCMKRLMALRGFNPLNVPLEMLRKEK